VNSVGPGLVDTDATKNQPQEMKQAVARFTPLGRIGVPDDIGPAVAFLCTEEARWITGQYLPLNGGMSSV
jgi:3-oxoacyl-[acyl-carrier protein] reductase